MKKIRVEDAVGQTLCHDMTAILETGFKGVKFHRGHVITEEDIPELKKIGKDHIFVWEPEADEVHEDDAATALTEAMCGEGIVCSGPSEGKMTIKAARDGLFCLSREALRAINMVDDYTVATIPGFIRVRKGQTLAGARIVPLVTKRRNVDAAVALARRSAPVMEVRPFLPLKAGVIITGSEVYYGRIEDAFEPIMREKLGSYGAQILGVTKCPDELEKITDAIEEFQAQGAELLLLTGGMSVDPDDLTPTAMRANGARLIFQGVPMQPGNMLTLSKKGSMTLIGVPGASMHSKITSLDVVLPRIFAGLPVTKNEMEAAGEGGLCMNCEVCRYPACYFGRF